MSMVPGRKVCCFCETWESGGIEAFLCHILEHMDLSHLRVDIVVCAMKESVFTRRLQELGVTFHQLSGSTRSIGKNQEMFQVLLEREGYDVIHFNLFQSLSLAYVRLSKKAGVPCRIVHSHNTALRKSKTRWVKLLLHRWGRWRYSMDATQLWACSGQAARFLFSQRALDKLPYRFIPNGIELERFAYSVQTRSQIRAQLHLEDAFVVGHIGRLCQQKNQMFLLDVTRELVAMEPRTCLLLVGDGEDRAALEGKAQQLGIQDHVLFYGTTPNPEQLMCAMDVFAFPSLFEGLAIVVVEAQANGLPLVSSQHMPPEAFVTPTAVQLPLEEGARAWAVRLLENRQQHGDYLQELRNAGFSVEDVAHLIQQTYMEGEA